MMRPMAPQHPAECTAVAVSVRPKTEETTNEGMLSHRHAARCDTASNRLEAITEAKASGVITTTPKIKGTSAASSDLSM